MLRAGDAVLRGHAGVLLRREAGGPARPARDPETGESVVQTVDETSAGHVQWREWRAELLRFVSARVSDADAAEDIVHDVLLRAHARIGELRDGDRLGAWLHRIARNAIIDHYRARRPSEPLPADLADESGPATRDLRRQLSKCLVPLLDHLPAGQRDAIRLSEIDGLAQHEVAERLGLSLSGAKSRVQRGRARLGTMLEACCRIETDGRGGIVDFERRRSSPLPACEGCAPDALP